MSTDELARRTTATRMGPMYGGTADRDRATVAGLASIAGAVAMALGGVLWGAADADLWGMVDGGVEPSIYLADAASATSTLTVGASIWIFGVVMLAIGLTLLASGSQTGAAAARVTSLLGTALAVPSFVMMIAITRAAERSPGDTGFIEALGFIAVRLDDLATVAIIGLTPPLLALANRHTWMPRWLSGWAVLCAVAGIVSVISIPAGQSGGIGFVLVPVGLFWVFSAGIVRLRTRTSAGG